MTWEMTMDTLFHYRLIEAVRSTLRRVGEEPFVLFRAQNPEDWFDLGWLPDFLRLGEHREVPLAWEGVPMPGPMDSLQVAAELPDEETYLVHRTGSVILRREALVSCVAALQDDGRTRVFVVLGEREPGALQRLRAEYDVYARRRSRSWPHLYVVGGDPLPRPQGLEWDDLVVPPSLGSDLRRQVDTFFASREAFHRLRLPHRRGILLTGPPGNGKTTALRIIACRRPEPFFLFSLTDEVERYQLDEAFNRAAYDAPSILCFEDIDSLFQQPGSLSHFLNRLDGLHPHEGVLVLATTNHPEKLDAALTQRPSRFDRVFVLGNPGAEERRRYLGRAYRDGFDECLVDWTDGFSLAQLKEVHVSACLEAIESGGAAPTLAASRRAVDRLQDQKGALENEWDFPRTIGFQPDRLRARRDIPTGEGGQGSQTVE